MNWKLGQAKEHLSEVVRRAQQEPQLIQNRDTVVAAVVDATTFEQFAAWQASQKTSMRELLSDLQRITRATGYTLDVPRRRDRPDAFAQRRGRRSGSAA